MLSNWHLPKCLGSSVDKTYAQPYSGGDGVGEVPDMPQCITAFGLPSATNQKTSLSFPSHTSPGLTWIIVTNINVGFIYHHRNIGRQLVQASPHLTWGEPQTSLMSSLHCLVSFSDESLWSFAHESVSCSGSGSLCSEAGRLLVVLLLLGVMSSPPCYLSTTPGREWKGQRHLQL